MSETKILQVKLIKGGAGGLEYRFREHLSKTQAVPESDDRITVELDRFGNNTCKNPVHQDLITAMQKLAPHLALMAEYIKPGKINDKAEVEKFSITSFSIGDKEDKEGITITGYRLMKTGKTMLLNTPYEFFDAEPGSRYVLMDQLQSDVESIEQEVFLYLEGKVAPLPAAQTEIPFGEVEGESGAKVTNMKVDHPEETLETNEDDLREGPDPGLTGEREWGPGEYGQLVEKTNGKKVPAGGAGKKIRSRKKKGE